MKRVVVTGLGVVSPFGTGLKAYWSGLAAGTCAIRPLSLIDTAGFRCGIGAEVPELTGGSRRRSRADRLALLAAREAVEDAGLGRHERTDTALVVGAVGGGMLEAEAWYWARSRSGADGHPGVFRSVLPYSHAEVVGHALGLGGPRESVVAACSSGAAAVSLAADLIADGVVPCAIAGGADALTRICYMGFNALKLLDTAPCRPFDRDRRGMSIGEGAAFLVLEDAESARARGVRVYAELRGSAITTDAYHATSPHPEGDGMTRAMRSALARAHTAPHEVVYVNAHGTATPQNDRIEARSIRDVFGDGRVLVSSTKSMIGHTMAAAGSLEATATILAVAHDLVPPTANHETPDPDVAFDCVPKTARDVAVDVAVSNSFGFGGQNVTLVFAKS
ncbi:MAG: beta-ketoacyl-[acyl-carrier-protein] synthase family protein [Candidatus Rokubacteria bacterium]|nr:beta-ketoacyl-[acyl-carrier-protein] synthase family protein [Candidatus Rokubacteria bacterium]